ncbi:hypothetical protein Goari_014313, partial [Gossypium aridum]|nr:hypothetical protein [Gossypium aridum]
GPTKSAVTRESSVASVSSNSEQDGSEKDEDSDDSDTDDVIEAEANEDMDESELDLDLAWKMLDTARGIAEKQQLGDTMEKVDILSALAEVDLERGQYLTAQDIESSLGNYQKALSILQQLVEPDHRQIAELNFRICTCLEIGSNPKEAIPYGQKAISVCKSRVQLLTNEIMISTGLASSSAASELGDGEQLSKGSPTVLSVKDKEAEIDNLVGLAEDLEKKANLEQLISDPKSIIAEIQGMASCKSRGGENNASPAAVNSSHMFLLTAM